LYGYNSFESEMKSEEWCHSCIFKGVWLLDLSLQIKFVVDLWIYGAVDLEATSSRPVTQKHTDDNQQDTKPQTERDGVTSTESLSTGEERE